MFSQSVALSSAAGKGAGPRGYLAFPTLALPGCERQQPPAFPRPLPAEINGAASLFNPHPVLLLETLGPTQPKAAVIPKIAIGSRSRGTSRWDAGSKSGSRSADSIHHVADSFDREL